jgi:pilus assembly protein FimV
MSENGEGKLKSPFDAETEDDTIALSRDELDDILSEAEIVQEPTTDEVPEGEGDVSDDGPKESSEEEISLDETISDETETTDDLLESEDFDISGEIDELTPKDLEDIELEEGDIENYTQELKTELGEELEMPDIEENESDLEEDLKDIEDELADIHAEGLNLEGDFDEDMDLDTYLDSVKSDIDLESIDLDEENEEDLVESPVIGDTEETINPEITSDEAFREAGIEGIGEEFGEDTEKGDEQLLRSLEEAELTPEDEKGEIHEDFSQPEEPGSEETEEQLQMEEESESAEGSFDGEVELTEEEENTLAQDIDLEEESAEEEEIVSVSGEDLERLSEEEPALREPEELEKEMATETEVSGSEEMVIDKTLYNDITVILQYMDNLLGELPDEKIKEFSKSKYFSLYKEVFEKLNLA